MNRERKAQKICAKLQRKLYFNGWTEQDKKRWDAVLGVIEEERAKKQETALCETHAPRREESQSQSILGMKNRTR